MDPGPRRRGDRSRRPRAGGCRRGRVFAQIEAAAQVGDGPLPVARISAVPGVVSQPARTRCRPRFGPSTRWNTDPWPNRSRSAAYRCKGSAKPSPVGPRPAHAPASREGRPGSTAPPAAPGPGDRRAAASESPVPRRARAPPAPTSRRRVRSRSRSGPSRRRARRRAGETGRVDRSGPRGAPPGPGVRSTGRSKRSEVSCRQSIAPSATRLVSWPHGRGSLVRRRVVVHLHAVRQVLHRRAGRGLGERGGTGGAGPASR